MAVLSEGARKVARNLADRRAHVWSVVKSPRLRSWVFDDSIDSVLYALALTRPKAFFIQVGSNDASFGDPLHPFLDIAQWRGIMIEPVPAIYERLVKKHGMRKGIAFENVAIASTEGIRPFYTVLPDEHDRHSWIDQLGSFNRDVILSHAHILPNLESRIRTLEVQCVSLATLCKRHNVTEIDLLHVDTEGADLEVLRSHDWARLQPSVVLYEHKHLNPTDRHFAEELLREAGYQILEQKGDTLAVRDDVLESSDVISRAWSLRSRTSRSR